LQLRIFLDSFSENTGGYRFKVKVDPRHHCEVKAAVARLFHLTPLTGLGKYLISA
jgi:hypothetical protein